MAQNVRSYRMTYMYKILPLHAQHRSVAMLSPLSTYQVLVKVLALQHGPWRVPPFPQSAYTIWASDTFPISTIVISVEELYFRSWPCILLIQTIQ